MDNPYKILQIDKDASGEVIKAAYRALIKVSENHPDLGGDVKKAQLLNEAYAKLTNPLERSDIDRKLRHTTKSRPSPEQMLVVCLNCGSVNKIRNTAQIALSVCGQCLKPFFEHRLRGLDAFNSNVQAKKAKSSNPPSDPFEVAIFLYDHRLYQRAIEHLRAMLAEDDSQADVNYLLGMCYYRQMRLKEANNIFLKNLQINKEHYLSRLYFGKSLMRSKLYAAALPHLRAAARLRPDHLKPLLLLGNCLFANARYSEAIEVFEQVVKRDSSNETAHYLWGISYFKMGGFMKALKVFEKGLLKFSNSEKFKRMIRTTHNFIVK